MIVVRKTAAGISRLLLLGVLILEERDAVCSFRSLPSSA